jgi:translation initiation factor 4G
MDLLFKTFVHFQGVLQMFLHEHVDLQIAALYAAQVFCYSHGFPKGK